MAEETYRNPLFGRRVDRYIPPELRQGLGALLAGADMLNPVSAYREYLKDVREGDVVGGVTNAAGFVAPGVASAVASRLARPALSAVAPYGEDAARVLMEVLSPTGAPEVSRGPMDMSRREFLAGLGAAAATPALPVDEMLEGLGRAGARGGARAIDELMGLIARRNALYLEEGKETADFVRSHGEYEDLLSDYLEEKFGSSIKDAEKAVSEKISTSDISREDLEGLSDRSLESLLSEITFDDSLVPDDLGKADLELADRIREILASRRPQAEVGSMLPDVTSRMVSGGDEFRRGLGSSSAEAAMAAEEDFGFMRDNPGGDWLRSKQEDADRAMSEGRGSVGRRRGITGSITGTIGMDRDMFLPTDVLSDLTGLMNERRAQGDVQFDELLARVRKEGFDPKQGGNKIVIAVNHRGEPYVLEGNTRISVARELGIPNVRAEVRYWNGGEDVDGPFAPNRVMSMGTPRPD